MENDQIVWSHRMYFLIYIETYLQNLNRENFWWNCPFGRDWFHNFKHTWKTTCFEGILLAAIQSCLAKSVYFIYFRPTNIIIVLIFELLIKDTEILLPLSTLKYLSDSTLPVSRVIESQTLLLGVLYREFSQLLTANWYFLIDALTTLLTNDKHTAKIPKSNTLC